MIVQLSEFPFFENASIAKVSIWCRVKEQSIVRTFPKLQLTSLFWYRQAADTIGRLKILEAVEAVWLGWAPTVVSQPYRRATDTTVPHEIIRIRIGGPPIPWCPLILELLSCAPSCICGPPIQWDSCGRRCWEAIVHPPIHFLQPPTALPL